MRTCASVVCAYTVMYPYTTGMRREGEHMISIINDGGDMQGVCVYRIQVDRHHICSFEHNRLDGLADCLQKAADAVELSEWADFVLLEEPKGG